jgi:hypothetical protein
MPGSGPVSGSIIPDIIRIGGQKEPVYKVMLHPERNPDHVTPSIIYESREFDSLFLYIIRGVKLHNENQ